MASNRPTDPMGMFQRGNELWRSGKFAQADAMYRRAIDSGDRKAAAEAGIKLGIMRKQLGNWNGAVIAFRAAIRTGHPEHAPTAAFLLTGVLQQRGRHREAAKVYEAIIDSGHRTLAPSAMYHLADLHRWDLPEDERDLSLAATLYQRAIDTDDPESAPKAMKCLADLYWTDNKPEQAAKLYQRAIESGHIEVAPDARRALRALQTELGQKAEAERGPSQRLAAGDSGCFLLIDGNGKVYGLWFEDVAVGDACSADPAKVKKILVDNHLTQLLTATYHAGPDGDGYIIEFNRYR